MHDERAGLLLSGLEGGAREVLLEEGPGLHADHVLVGAYSVLAVGFTAGLDLEILEGVGQDLLFVFFEVTVALAERTEDQASVALYPCALDAHELDELVKGFVVIVLTHSEEPKANHDGDHDSSYEFSFFPVCHLLAPFLTGLDQTI